MWNRKFNFHLDLLTWWIIWENLFQHGFIVKEQEEGSDTAADVCSSCHIRACSFDLWPLVDAPLLCMSQPSLCFCFLFLSYQVHDRPAPPTKPLPPDPALKPPPQVTWSDLTWRFDRLFDLIGYRLLCVLCRLVSCAHRCPVVFESFGWSRGLHGSKTVDLIWTRAT